MSKGSIGDMVKFDAVWNSLRDFHAWRSTILVLFKNQTNWAIDKLSCKNLFEPLILDLVQFFTLKDVGMYKMK